MSEPTGDELMRRLEAFEGPFLSEYGSGLLEEFGGLVGTRVARVVADTVMFTPSFTMDESFRDELVARFFTP